MFRYFQFALCLNYNEKEINRKDLLITIFFIILYRISKKEELLKKNKTSENFVFLIMNILLVALNSDVIG